MVNKTIRGESEVKECKIIYDSILGAILICYNQIEAHGNKIYKPLGINCIWK